MAPELMERSASDQSVSVLPAFSGMPTVSPFQARHAESGGGEDPSTGICTMAELDALVSELDQIDATLSELR